MQKIKIRLPATISQLGPGLSGLGLALALHTHVEISGRADNELKLDLRGVDADAFETPLEHPLIRAMSRFFQRLERTQLGINIRVENHIPLASGLGAETAFSVAGVLGANNLMGDVYHRDEMLEFAASISEPGGAAASLLGGLAVGLLEDEELQYRSLPVGSLSVVVVLPELEDYQPPHLPDNFTKAAALRNMARIPLLVDALRHGDVRRLAESLQDDLFMPLVSSRISAYAHVAEIAARRGALKVIPCGAGPAIMALTEKGHQGLAEDMRLAFKSAGIDARAWVLPVDTQGVVISFAQTA